MKDELNSVASKIFFLKAGTGGGGAGQTPPGPGTPPKARPAAHTPLLGFGGFRLVVGDYACNGGDPADTGCNQQAVEGTILLGGGGAGLFLCMIVCVRQACGSNLSVCWRYPTAPANGYGDVLILGCASLIQGPPPAPRGAFPDSRSFIAEKHRPSREELLSKGWALHRTRCDGRAREPESPLVPSGPWNRRTTLFPKRRRWQAGREGRKGTCLHTHQDAHIRTCKRAVHCNCLHQLVEDLNPSEPAVPALLPSLPSFLPSACLFRLPAVSACPPAFPACLPAFHPVNVRLWVR